MKLLENTQLSTLLTEFNQTVYEILAEKVDR